jgi:phage shock protein A
MPRIISEVQSELAETESAMLELGRRHDLIHRQYSQLQVRLEALEEELAALCAGTAEVAASVGG